MTKKTYTFKNPIKRRGAEAKALQQKQYGHRIVLDKTKYSRKRKEKNNGYIFNDEPKQQE